jgi:transcriptional regulator with GAF, ATPase, and Fis domain
MDFDFNRLLADAARDLAEEPSTLTALERAVALCADVVERCDMAGVSIIEGGEIRTMAASNDMVRKVDQLQLELREGPCFSALEQEDSINSGDLASDGRWPTWGPRIAQDLGLHSVLSLRLLTTDKVIGALTLYAGRTDAFGPDDLMEAEAHAVQATVALAASIKEAQFNRALETRTVIGQATGMLIERFGLSPEQAFAVMRRVSQHHNVKLRALAEHLVETGVLLDLNAERPGPSPAEDRPG